MSVRLCGFACLGIGLGLLTGCGSSPSTEIRGTVSLDGRPISGAQVQLLSQGNAVPTIHTAATDLQGAFTIKAAGNEMTLPKPGKYVVLVSKISGGMGEAKNELPARYADANKSPLKLDITDTSQQLPPFELQSKP